MYFIQTTLFVVLILFLNCQTVLAKGSVVAEITPPEGTIEDRYVLRVTVTGAGSQPIIPDLGPLEIVGQSKSSRVQMQMGTGLKMQTTRTTEYSYELAVEEPGNYTVPPVEVEIEGSKEYTQPITLSVLAAGASVGRGSTGRGSTGRGSRVLPSQRSSSSPSSQVLLETQLTNPTPYVGESTVLILRILTSGSIQQAQLVDVDVPNAKKSEIKKVKQYVTTRNGKQYSVNEKRFVLLPTKVGPITIPRMKLRAYVPDTTSRQQGRRRRSPLDDFFGDFDSMFNRSSMVPKQFVSPQTYMEVQALPKPRPADFSGVVGDFTLSATTSPTELKVGESGTLSIRLEGSGKSAGLEDFKPEFPESFQVYPDKPQLVESARAEGWNSKQSFKFAFVPKSGGKFDLGEIKIRVFDTKKDKYRLLKTSLGSIKVEGPALTAAQGVSSQTSKALPNSSSGRSLPEIISLKELQVKPLLEKTPTAVWFGVLAMAWLPLILFLCRGFLGTSVQASRKQKRVLLKSLKAAVQSYRVAEKSDIKTKVLTIDQKVRELLSSVLEKNCQTMTPSEVGQQLDSYHNRYRKKLADREVLDVLKNFLAKVDQLKYSGSSDSQFEDFANMAAVVEALESLV